MKKRKTPRDYDHRYRCMKVRRGDGRETTITVDAEAALQAHVRLGWPAFSQLVRQAALDYEKFAAPGTRSGFVRRVLYETLTQCRAAN